MRFKFILILFLVGMFCSCSSSKSSSSVDTSFSQALEKGFLVTEVDKAPEVYGGLKALYSQLRIPREARREKISGRVIVQFLITKDGKAKNFELLNSLGHGLDEMVLDILKDAHFRPGEKDEKPIDVQCIIPFTFNINS